MQARVIPFVQIASYLIILRYSEIIPISIDRTSNYYAVQKLPPPMCNSLLHFQKSCQRFSFILSVVKNGI